MAQTLPSEGIARAWALTDGTILSVDSGIVNCMGYSVQEMCGHSISTFIKDQATQEE